MQSQTLCIPVREKFKKPFAPLSFPIKKSEDMYQDYIVSRNLRNKPTYQVSNVVDAKPKSQLNQARRNFKYNNDQLIEKRRLAKAIKRAIDEDLIQVKKKARNLRESMIHFSLFVKENQEKRERAEKKLFEERQLHVKREQDIKELKYFTIKLYEIKKKFEDNIRSFRLYDNFLQTVVDYSSDFKSVDVILTRYDAIQEAREISLKKQEDDMTTFEKIASDVQRNMEENKFKIMGMRNKLADLRVRFGSCKKNSLDWETSIEKIRNETMYRKCQMYVTRDATWNLYKLMCKRKQKPVKLSKGDFEWLLIEIKRTMLLVKNVLHKVIMTTRRLGL